MSLQICLQLRHYFAVHLIEKKLNHMLDKFTMSKRTEIKSIFLSRIKYFVDKLFDRKIVIIFHIFPSSEEKPKKITCIQ